MEIRHQDNFGRGNTRYYEGLRVIARVLIKMRKILIKREGRMSEYIESLKTHKELVLKNSHFN